MTRALITGTAPAYDEALQADRTKTKDQAPFVYPSGIDHLADELVYVRALLSRYLAKQSALRPAEGDDAKLAGFAVGADEIERFLEGATAPLDQDQEAFIDALRLQIDDRIAQTLAAGESLPLVSLYESFALSSLEARILLVLLAPEIEPAFERAYSFAWNDFTRKTADVGFVLGMVLGDFRERLEGSLVFSPTEPLVWNGLVEVAPPISSIQRGYLARPVKLASRVVSFLIGDPTPDELIQPVASMVSPQVSREEVLLQAEDFDNVWRALTTANSAPAPRVMLRGAPGCGKKMILEAFFAEHNKPLLNVDLAALFTRGHGIVAALRAARREAGLSGAALYFDCSAIEQSDDVSRQHQLDVEHALADFPGFLAFGACTAMPFFDGARGGVTDIHIPIPEATFRTQLWEKAIPAGTKLVPGTDLEQLGKQYPLSGGAIFGAARGAVSRAKQRNPKRPVVRRSDLVDSARQQLTGRLSQLATRITTSLSWDDLVLPEESMDRLRELTAFARHRKRVFEEWGFGAILPYGRGLSALFHGPPGTGKTMVAGIIAGELGMDLFRVDLSRIVSKYVGETEKNLGRIFDEASQSHSVLLFDEADSLFAKRTEVKSATDRYANLEVNYLLQRMEDFEGVTVLTTNFEGGLDDAFKRRLRFRIEFPSPDEAERESLWRKMIPSEAKLAKGIRFDDLAYDYDLTGGHIKNAVVRAAFIAAERDDVIRYEDFRASAALECKEIGRLVREWPEHNQDEEGTE